MQEMTLDQVLDHYKVALRPKSSQDMKRLFLGLFLHHGSGVELHKLEVFTVPELEDFAKGLYEELTAGDENPA